MKVYIKLVFGKNTFWINSKRSNIKFGNWRLHKFQLCIQLKIGSVYNIFHGNGSHLKTNFYVIILFPTVKNLPWERSISIFCGKLSCELLRKKKSHILGIIWSVFFLLIQWFCRQQRNLAIQKIRWKKTVKVKVLYFLTILTQHAWSFRILILHFWEYCCKNRGQKSPNISIFAYEIVAILPLFSRNIFSFLK